MQKMNTKEENPSSGAGAEPDQAATPVEAAKEKETVTLKEALQRYIERELALLNQEWPTATVRRGCGDEAKRFKLEGFRIGDYSTRWVAGREQSRWDEVKLFALKDGRFLTATEYVTCWQGEEYEYSATIKATLDDVDDQRLLDDMRKYLCDQLNVKIPVADVAAPLSELEQEA